MSARVLAGKRAIKLPDIKDQIRYEDSHLTKEKTAESALEHRAMLKDMRDKEELTADYKAARTKLKEVRRSMQPKSRALNLRSRTRHAGHIGDLIGGVDNVKALLEKL